MDFTEWLDLLWSPLWFFWDLCGTVGIILLIRRWIKGSVTDTKDSVITELKNPDTAGAVRSAMDIVSGTDIKILRGEVDGIRADAKAIREEVRAKDISYQTSLDSRIQGLIADLSKKIESQSVGFENRLLGVQTSIQGAVESVRADIHKVDLSPEKIQAAVETSAVNQMKAERSKMSREQREAMEKLQEEYVASQFKQMDAALIYKALTGVGVAPGMAQYAAYIGPTAVEWALRASLGDLKADRLLESWAEGRMKLMPPAVMPAMPGAR